MNPEHLFHHVQDSTYFELPQLLGGKLEIPQPLQLANPILGPNPAAHLEAFDLTLTKFMVLQVVAAVGLILLFVPLAHRTVQGGRPRGRLTNLLEAMLLFIRDEVARPAIGKHDADRFLPYLWTLFFFVLACNLLGLVPWAGSATGALACTGMLALCSFAMVVGTGMSKLGAVGFWKAQVPHMDLPFVLAIFLLPMIFLIEVLGLLIKHIVLAVRLLANMMAGHLVLAVLLAFIAASAGSIAWYGVTPASVLGATALMLLELFVAFLQAYIFTFLTALFIGMAVHPH
ncbi:MAG: F0F1 ATP synthase subunit A [Planctomycetales bacterium]|nr:F0F1 ATP synthase subunit A [Planctomycetales bacterium]NIM09784.1 F0F1 ATP synthase subunit A [Planctomycetales bacterium]NIN09253.1 F0F1 ATP synthase subunit A [Planctomycetales bacterium]NIN78353.1 F0F1 ATP synthase subunit A [Planctomycetales bacterium]NIO35532.1 F0F1 ATP synthase subunit A [Planctomycetales bacterium]